MSANARVATMSDNNITIAQAPFDDANADVVFRTSDHVEFRIFRLILTLSSPFFQGMFSLPQPSDPSSSSSPITTTTTTTCTPTNAPDTNLPVLDVPEDAYTIDALLRFLYPNTHPPTFRSFAHARDVALAASKYYLDPVALDKIAQRVEAQYAAARPLQVYLLACRMGWEAVARSAARGCLDPVRMFGAAGEEPAPEPGADVLGFPGAGVAYHRLEAYRHACQCALRHRLEGMPLFRDGVSCSGNADGEGAPGVQTLPYTSTVGVWKDCLGQWTTQYLSNIKLAVSNSPRKETLDDPSLMPDRICNLSQCNVTKACAIAKARLEVVSEIESALSEVELRFSP